MFEVQKIVRVLVVLLFVSIGLFGQAPTYSLADCLQYALNNSHKTKQARLDKENLQHLLREKRSQGLPQIRADLNYQRAFSLPEQFLTGNFNGTDAATVNAQTGRNNMLFTGLVVEQNIISPGLKAGLQLAETTQELHDLLLQRAEEDIIFDIAEQYYALMKNQELLRVIDLNLKRLNDLVALLTLQQENDFIKKTDVEGVRIKITELEVQHRRLSAGINTQKQAIKLMMGMDLSEEITLQRISVDTTVNANATEPDFEAFTTNQLLERQKSVVHSQRQIEKVSALPSVKLFGYLGLQFQDDAFAFGDAEPWNTNAFLGVSVEAPIFDGGARKARLQQQTVQLQKIQNDQDGARQLAQFEYQRAVEDWTTQQEVLRMQQERIVLLQRQYEQVLLQYKEESSSLLELLNAEADLRSAEANRSAQLFDLQQAILKLLKSKGQLKVLLKE